MYASTFVISPLPVSFPPPFPLSLSSPLSIVLGKWKTMGNYTLTKPNNVYCDIHTGKGYQTLMRPDSIGTFFNTDGISPFKSFRLTVWPVYLAFPSLPPSICMNKANVITCAYWVGQEKPSMAILLKSIKQLLSRLQNIGITGSTSGQQLRKIIIQPLFGVVDLIAKVPVLNIHGTVQWS